MTFCLLPASKKTVQKQSRHADAAHRPDPDRPQQGSKKTQLSRSKQRAALPPVGAIARHSVQAHPAVFSKTAHGRRTKLIEIGFGGEQAAGNF